MWGINRHSGNTGSLTLFRGSNRREQLRLVSPAVYRSPMPATCSYCGTPIRFLRTITGRVRAFYAEPVPRADDLHQVGHIPVRGRYMRPVRDIADRKLAGISLVYVLHLCQQYRSRPSREPQQLGALVDLLRPRVA